LSVNDVDVVAVARDDDVDGSAADEETALMFTGRSPMPVHTIRVPDSTRWCWPDRTVER